MIITVLLLWFADTGTISGQQRTSNYTPAYTRAETGANSSVLVESTFNSGMEGWSIVGDGKALTHESSGGRPGGYIHATDRASGGIWLFQAPSEYYGDRSAAYNGVLNFDLKLFKSGGSVSTNDFVHLSGAGMELIFRFEVIPTTQWTAYRIPLREQAGWIKSSSGQQPTSTEFKQVLSDLQDLKIRGEHISGGDREGLDNVQLRSDRLVEIHIDPGATYLHVAEGDEAAEANPMDLRTLHLTAHEDISLNLSGDYTSGSLTKNDMIGVFSSSSTLREESETHRVPGAIDAGEDIRTSRTRLGDEPTDIPADFPIYNTVISLPSDASFLFVSPQSNSFQDNSDTDDNYTIRLRPVENINNYALDFNGSSNVRVPHARELNPENLTVEAWVKARSYPDYASVLTKSSTDYWESGYGLSNYNNGPDINFFINTWDQTFVRDTIPPNQWTHVAATYDGSVISLYINGQLEDTTHYSEEIDHSEGPLYIGMGQGNYYWDGIIEEVRIWDHTRMQSEIASAYKTTLTGNENGLVAYYPMDGGSGSNVADASGEGNAGVINGANWTFSAAPIGGSTFLISDEGAYARDSLRFSWTRSPNANVYRLDISTLPDASGIIDRIQLEDTTSYAYSTQTLSGGQRYYARVAASTDGGSSYSTYTSFTDGITVDRSAPTVEAPVGRIPGIGTRITFFLSANDNGTIATYGVQIDDDQSFTNPVKDTAIAAGNPQVTIAGERGKTYYARAYAIDEAGNQSAYSPVSSGVSVSQLADLQVSDIQIPDEIVSGSKFQPEWTVENSGLHSTRSSGWQDAIYLSRDKSLDEDDLKIRDVSNASSLSKGASYRQSPDFRLPVRLRQRNQEVAIQGDYYVLIRTDAGNREEEQSETNNTTVSAGVMTTELPPLPDLKVTVMLDPIPYCLQSIPCASMSSGSATLAKIRESDAITQLSGGSCIGYAPCGPVEYVGQKRRMHLSPEVDPPQKVPRAYVYRFVVKNQGDSDLESQFRSMVYFQEGDAEHLDIDNAVVMGEIFTHGPIEAGETDTAVSGIVPRNFAAINEGHLWLDLNYRDDVFEGAGADNNLFRDSVVTQFRLLPPSDLEGISLNVPASAESGDSVNVSWEIQNNGPGSVAPTIWYDEVFVSQSQTLDKDQANRIARFPQESSDENTLENNSRYTNTEKVKLPEGIQGTYYIHLQGDATELVNEYVPQEQDYEDNNTVRTSMEINLADYPDFQVTNIDLPSEANAGSSLLLQYTVQNKGNAVDEESDWADRVVLSRQKELSRIERDSILTTTFPSGEVSSGDSYSRSKTVQLPSDLEEGTYYLYLETNYREDIYEHGTSADNNLTRSDAIQIHPEPRADLSVTLDQLTPQSPKTGQPVAVQFSVSNNGPATERSSWYDRLYLSANPTLNRENDIEIGHHLHKGSLGQNGGYTVQDTVVMPNDVTGEYYLIVRTDPENRNREYERANNSAVTEEPVVIQTGPRPDLTITSVDVLDSPVSGQPMDVEIEVTNQGADISGDETWFQSWNLMLNPNNMEQTHFLTAREISRELPGGASYLDTVTVTVPPFATDAFFLRASSDSRDDKFEVNEENNSETKQINISVPPPSDLVVENVEVPDSAQPGEQVTVSFDIANQGANKADGILYNAIYISDDGKLDTGDPRLAIRRSGVTDLMPQTSTNKTMTVRMPKLSDSHARVTSDQLPYDALQNVETDSLKDEVPGVLPGDYRLLVWTDVRNNLRESEDGNNRTASAETARLTVPELSLRSQVTTTLQAGQRRYYKLSLSANQDLRIDFGHEDSEHPDRNLGVYVAYERPATSSDYDAAHPAGEEGETSVLLPETRSGTYYVMFRNPYLVSDEQGTVNIEARSFGFDLFSISPDEGGSKGRVISSITGARLTEETELYLEGENGQTVNGEVIERHSTMEWDVRFDLRQAAKAVYDVVAVNGSDEVRIEKGYEIVRTIQNKMEYAISGPPQLLHGAKSTFEISIRNENNIDMDIVRLTVSMPGDHQFRLVADEFRGTLIKTTNPDSVDLPPAGVPSGLSIPDAGLNYDVGEFGSITAYAKGVRVGEELSVQVKTDKIFEAPDKNVSVIVTVRGFSENEFLESTMQALDRVTHQLDKAGNSRIYDQLEPYKSRLLSRLQSSNLRNQLRQYYTSVGLLGDGPLEGKSMPLIYKPDFYELQSDQTESQTARIQSNHHPSPCAAMGATLGFSYEMFAFGYGVFSILVTGANPVVGATMVLSAFMMANQMHTAMTGGGGPYSTMFCFLVGGSVDPNKIVGPSGFGDANWVQRDKRLRYRILFENDPERANAPARTVAITQPLDSALSVRTIELESFGFGSYEYEIPENQTYYSRTVDVTDSLGVQVRFNAGYDQHNGELFFSFRSIDPQTGEVPNNLQTGFLPPNDNAPEGEGFVEYSVRPRSDVSNGTEVKARADIVFDRNAPLVTNEFVNVLDAEAPTTSIIPEESEIIDTTDVLLKWNGNDSQPGSGIRSYTLYGARKDSSFDIIEQGIRDTSFVFEGQEEVTYEFFVQATDQVNNLEADKRGSATRISVDIGEKGRSSGTPETFQLHQNYPNPFNPMTNITYELPSQSQVHLTVYNILGQRIRTLVDAERKAGIHTIRFNAGNLSSGIYFYRIKADDFRKTHKMLLIK